MRTLLTALFMIFATQAVAQQSRDAMRECFSEVENVIIMLEKLREVLVAVDERLYGDELASMFFDFGTSRHLETVFNKIKNDDEVAIHGLPEVQKSELLSKIHNFLTMRSVTIERLAILADIDIKTDDQMKIADAKADYVQACVKSIEDGKHFTNFNQSEPQLDFNIDKGEPKVSSAPLTGGEKEAFSNQVFNCWAINKGSRASEVTVVVSMDMQPDGKVVASSIEMIGYKDGSLADANFAFQAARRAVLRCQRDGYDLPNDKYEHWRNIELTFDPNEWR